jgi:hypothetical protein
VANVEKGGQSFYMVGQALGRQVIFITSAITSGTTGKASFLIDGGTAHRLLLLYINHELNDTQFDKLKKNIENILLITVDESSMLGAVLLERIDGH